MPAVWGSLNSLDLSSVGPISSQRLIKMLRSDEKPAPVVKELMMRYPKFAKPTEAIELLKTCVQDNLTYLGFWVSSVNNKERAAWLDFLYALEKLEHVDLRRNEDWPYDFTEAVLKILVLKPNLTQLQLPHVRLSRGCVFALAKLFVVSPVQSALAKKARLSAPSRQSRIYELDLQATRPSRRPADAAKYDDAMGNMLDYIRLYSYELPLAVFEADEHALADGTINREASNADFLRKARVPFALLRDDLHANFDLKSMARALYESIASGAEKPNVFPHRVWLFEDANGHLHPLGAGEHVRDALPFGVFAQPVRIVNRVGHMVAFELKSGELLSIDAEFLEPVNTQLNEVALQLSTACKFPLGSAVEFEEAENQRSVLGIVVGYTADSGYLVLSPTWNEDAQDPFHSLHQVRVVQNCRPAAFYRWDVLDPDFYFPSYLSESCLQSMKVVDNTKLSLYTTSKDCLVNRRSLLPMSKWLEGLDVDQPSLPALMANPDLGQLDKENGSAENGPSVEAALRRSVGRPRKTAPMTQSGAVTPMEQPLVEKPLSKPAASGSFDPNHYESRKVVCVVHAMDPPPKAYGVPLFPCFFVKWENREGGKFALVTNFARSKDEAVSARTQLTSVPAGNVFFVHFHLAVAQGLAPMPEQDASFAEYAHELGSVIEQPWDERETGAITRVIVNARHFASLSLATLAMIPTLGNGIDVRVSRVPDGGRGVYVTRAFLENEIITMYSGHKFGELQRRGMQELGLGTHCKPLEHKLAYLDGLKVAFKGMPVAQLVNDGGPLANASFVAIEEIPFTGDKVIAIQANRYIFPGEEIYLNYGLKFWSEQNFTPLSVPPVLFPTKPTGKKTPANNSRRK